MAFRETVLAERIDVSGTDYAGFGIHDQISIIPNITCATNPNSEGCVHLAILVTLESRGLYQIRMTDDGSENGDGMLVRLGNENKDRFIDDYEAITKSVQYRFLVELFNGRFPDDISDFTIFPARCRRQIESWAAERAIYYGEGEGYDGEIVTPRGVFDKRSFLEGLFVSRENEPPVSFLDFAVVFADVLGMDREDLDRHIS